MEANWLARILDEIEGYARENGLDSLMAEVRNARRITSLEMPSQATDADLPASGPVAAAPAAEFQALSPPT